MEEKSSWKPEKWKEKKKQKKEKEKKIQEVEGRVKKMKKCIIAV